VSTASARWILLAAAATACTGDAVPPTKSPPEAGAKSEPAARKPLDANADPRSPPATRTRGAVQGEFVPEVTRIVVGAPFIVRFTMKNTGPQPLTVTIGGDSYAQGQLRFAWLVRDSGGDVVCDLRGRPESMAGAGAQGDKTFAPGETYETYLAPQRGCPALSQPGRYQLRGVRVLVHDRDAPTCAAILPPDTTVEPLDDRGVPLEEPCKTWLLGAPAIATEMTLEVAPYDPEAVRTAIDEALVEQNEQRDHELSNYGTWLCLTAGCEVKWGEPVREWLRSSANSLPPAWPGPK
jgi:hypothetical protein